MSLEPTSETCYCDPRNNVILVCRCLGCGHSCYVCGCCGGYESEIGNARDADHPVCTFTLANPILQIVGQSLTVVGEFYCDWRNSSCKINGYESTYGEVIFLLEGLALRLYAFKQQK